MSPWGGAWYIERHVFVIQDDGGRGCHSARSALDHLCRGLHEKAVSSRSLVLVPNEPTHNRRNVPAEQKVWPVDKAWLLNPLHFRVGQKFGLRFSNLRSAIFLTFQKFITLPKMHHISCKTKTEREARGLLESRSFPSRTDTELGTASPAEHLPQCQHPNFESNPWKNFNFVDTFLRSVLYRLQFWYLIGCEAGWVQRPNWNPTGAGTLCPEWWQNRDWTLRTEFDPAWDRVSPPNRRRMNDSPLLGWRDRHVEPANAHSQNSPACAILHLA